MRIVQPAGWPRPRGYAHGVVAEGRLIMLAGQIGCDDAGRLVAGDFTAQAGQALRNIVTLVAAAGGRAENVVRLTWFVTDIAAYCAGRALLGPHYRAAFGRHYPAMSVIGVAALVEPGALVEIEATAVLPPA